MRHTHNPAENSMLANTYLDIVEGLMTREEATAYLKLAMNTTRRTEASLPISARPGSPTRTC